MLPLNQIMIICFKLILVLKPLHTPTIKKGKKTPIALAIIQDIKTAKKNE